MWPSRRNRHQQICADLDAFASTTPLLGIADANARDTFAWQIVASLRRREYTAAQLARDVSPNRANTASDMFDPEAAAIFHSRSGNLDEAVWLAFLATHFGKNAKTGWTLLRGFYSGLGAGDWTWNKVSANPKALSDWLAANHNNLQGAFGNHRKYESLKPGSNGTAAVVSSYIDWVGPAQSHKAHFAKLVLEGGNDPHAIFAHFYDSLTVHRFGRLAKFDFLSMLGRLALAPIEPGSPYIQEATGPKRGARLLFLGNPEDRSADGSLDSKVVQLGNALGVGMQVMEDAICNWQKSPTKFVHFRG